jgi:photosystem II stability/assembly factor-like uncharacterized protein
MLRALSRGTLAGALGACTLVLLSCGGRSGSTDAGPGFSIEPGELIFWQQSDAPEGNDFRSLLSDSRGHLFVASSKTGVFQSVDRGRTWVHASAGLTASFVHSLAASPTGKLFAGTDGKGVFQSQDGGTTWSPAGLEAFSVLSLLVSPTGLVLAGTNGGVFRSDDDGKIWVHANNGLQNRAVLALVRAGAGEILAGTDQGGIYYTRSTGDEWVYAGLTGATVRALHTAHDATIYAATSSGVYLSADNGLTWSQRNKGLPNSNTWTVASDPTGLTFVGSKGGVFRSSDQGNHWQAINGGMGSSYVRSCLVTADGYLIAGTNGGGIYRSIHPAAASR